MNDIIEKGYLIKKADGRSYPYTMIFLRREHLEQVLELRASVLDLIPDKDFCIPSPDHVISDSLADQGVVAGVFVEGQLVAFRILYFVDNNDYNLGMLVGINSNELSHVVHMEFSIVLPEFRGNGLQKRLSLITLEQAKKRKGLLHVCSMVSPKNFPSILDKFSCNLYIENLALVHGGHWRYIFHQNLVRPFRIKESTITDIAITDYDKQITYLKQGYVGFALLKKNEAMAMLFARPAV